MRLQLWRYGMDIGTCTPGRSQAGVWTAINSAEPAVGAAGTPHRALPRLITT